MSFLQHRRAFIMNINEKMLSIPPYVSTSWENIISISTEKENLVILLKTGAKITIPNLPSSVTKAIFATHAKYLETTSISPTASSSGFSMGLPLKIGVDGIESLGNAMRHNPERANDPDIPQEILKKIASISKIMDIDSPDMLPKPEPGCNCMHCQIARAISGKTKDTASEEELVTEEDLKFKTWDIEQTGENLYTVSNPIDKTEKYTVFLGTPQGCTCGEKKCEHIRAVLTS